MLSAARSDEGSLPLVILASIVGIGLAMALFSSVLTSERTVRSDREFTTAFHGADAAVQSALAYIRSTDLNNSVAVGSVVTGGDTTGNVDYTYEATKGVLEWEVVAIGTINGSSRYVEATISLPSRFYTAAFGKTLVGFKGGNGASSYNGSAVDTGKGAVGTNGDIELNGSAYADELFLYGPTASCTKTVSNCDAMLPYTQHAPQPYIPETDFIEDALDAAWCQASLAPYRSSVNGPLVGGAGPGPDGEYCFSSMTFDSNMTPDFSADDVVVYVSGNISSSNQVKINCKPCIDRSFGSSTSTADVNIMLASDPVWSSGLQLYSVGASVSLGNHTHLGAAVYAPNASCHGNPSNAQGWIYGAMTCNDINNQGGWSFWFDERLREIGTTEWRIDGIREEIGGTTSF